MVCTLRTGTSDTYRPCLHKRTMLSTPGPAPQRREKATAYTSSGCLSLSTLVSDFALVAGLVGRCRPCARRSAGRMPPYTKGPGRQRGTAVYSNCSSSSVHEFKVQLHLTYELRIALCLLRSVLNIGRGEPYRGIAVRAAMRIAEPQSRPHNKTCTQRHIGVCNRV